MRGLKINELRSQNVSWSRKVSNYNKLRLNKQKQAEKRITVILNTNLNAFTMSFSYSKNKRYANLYATTSSGTSKSCWLTLCNLGPIRIAVFLYQLRFLNKWGRPSCCTLCQLPRFPLLHDFYYIVATNPCRRYVELNNARRNSKLRSILVQYWKLTAIKKVVENNKFINNVIDNTRGIKRQKGGE